jgi:alpha-ribazole phosphatase
MEIYLVRHTTPDIAKGICYGQSDIDVKPTFLVEVETVKDQLPKGDFVVYTSPLKRCLKLALKISNNPIVDDRLMELNFGDWELKPWNDIPIEELQPWMKNYFNHPTKNGESMQELIARAQDFLTVLKAQKSSAIVVTHAGVIRIIEGLSNNLDQSKWMNLKVAYGEVKVLSFD